MKKILLLWIVLILSPFAGTAQFTPATLGKASSFTVLSGTGVHNAGDTKINGNVGVSPGNGFTGFPPGIVNGATVINQPAAAEAQHDLAATYTQAASETPTQILTGQNLGGLTLQPGVYRFEGNADLNGTLTLDNNGDPNALFIFQVNGDLQVGSNARVALLEQAQPRIRNIFWQVSDSARLGSGSTFRGTIMAQQAITANTGATVYGRLLSINEAVNLTNNIITIPTDLSVTITKSAGNTDGNYFIGETVTYTITAQNAGPIGETNVRVTVLNSGLSFISASAPAGSTFDSSTSQWSINNFAAGATATLEIKAQINSNATAILVNNVTILGDGLDEIRGNNENSVSICVAPSDPGTISGPASVCVGKEVTYSVIPTNVASQYNWTVPSGWQIVSNPSAPSITVVAGLQEGEITVTAQNVCSVSDPSTKQIATSSAPPPAPGPITSNVAFNNPCAGSEDITFSIEPVSSANSYVWTVPDGWQILSGANTTSITVRVGSTAGNVEVKALNACGPSAPSTLQVVPSTTPPTEPDGISGNTTPCVGETVTYIVTGETGATYFNWKFPESWKITKGDSTNTVQVLVGSTAGNVVVTAINGCGTSSASLTLAPMTTLTPSDINGTLAPCASNEGMVYTYSVAETQGISSYFWRVSGNLTIMEGQGTASIKVKVTTSVTSGNIVVSALNNCGQSAEKSITVVPITKPNRPLAITASTPKPCAGEENLVYSIDPVAGATSYVWTLPADWIIMGPADGTTITVKAGSTAGNITVAAVNSCGAGPERTLAVTPSLDVPTAPLSITGTANPCAGDLSVSYSVAEVVSATGYVWEVPAGWTITSGAGTSNIQVTIGSASGQIRVTAKNNCGNSTAAVLEVAPSTAPAPAPGSITGSTPSPCVNEENLTYSIDAVKGAQSYEWTVTGDWIITGGNGTTSIEVKAGTGSGTITVRAKNGCGLSDASSLTVQPATGAPLAPVAINGRAAVCTNEDNLTYSISPVAGATNYTWLISSADWSIIQGQGTTSVQVKAGVNPAEISVIAKNNCGVSEAFVLAVQTSNALPATPGPITGNNNLCAGNTNVRFSIAPVEGAISYVWSVPSSWSYTQSTDGTSIQVTVGNTSGKVRVKAVNGCGESAESEFNVTPTLTPPATPGSILAGSAAVCASEEGVTYLVPPVTGASTYSWTVPNDWEITGGQGTNIITVTVGKSVGQITVTAFNNCGASSASTLTVNPSVIPEAPVAINGEKLPCAGSSENKYSVTEVSGATAYEWTVPEGWTITSGAGTASITVMAGNTGGNITVKANNHCGSSAATTLPVSVSTTAPPAPLAISGSNSVCSGATSLEYSVDDVDNTSTYIWSLPAGWLITSGQGTSRIMVEPSNSPGTISVMAQNGCGISAASILTVTVTGQMPSTPNNITGPTQACANAQEVVYSVGAVSGATAYEWAVPEGWEITSGQGSATIKVTTGTSGGAISVKAENGCGISQAKTIAVTTINAPEQPQLINGLAHQCVNTTGVVYSIEAVAGADTYTWSVPEDWKITQGQGTTSITVTVGNKSGDIKVFAENKCGISNTITLAVTSSTTPSPAPGPIRGAVGLVCKNQERLVFSVDPVSSANSYLWDVPEGWQITSGQGTTSITVRAGTTSGSISIKGVNGCGESEANYLAVNISEATSVQLGAIEGETSFCATQSGLRYQVPPIAGATNYTWTLPAGWEITSGKGTNSITVTAGTQTGTISVVASNDCSSSQAQTLALVPNAMPETPASIMDTSSPCGGLSFTVSPSVNAISYTWEVPQGWTIISGQGTTSIQIKAPEGSKPGVVGVSANSENCSSPYTFITADPAMAEGELEFANALTPNGDNINDTWKIRNIENYKENDLVILNRWGTEVYRQKGYHNNWNGGELSGGTYFYVLNVKTCDGFLRSYKGYVMIVR
ncbi:ice-binding family protein [Rufibacter roseus]|uniref:Ice-binding family protein n=1 Tax=Rufibacter roseus TaxID=1567108 RepID=A0ABW2DL86_9BACT|nr:ice-binding family protein [Rufibacter roseus]